MLISSALYVKVLFLILRKVSLEIILVICPEYFVY